MDALKTKLQATLLFMVTMPALLLKRSLSDGPLLSLSLLKRIYVKDAGPNLYTKPKKDKYPLRQVSKNVISFDGNVKSYNTETGRITTHKWSKKNEH